MATYKLLLQRLLLVLVVLATVWFCWTNSATLGQVLQLPFADLLLILLSYCCFNLLTAATTWGMLRHRGRVVPFVQMLAINSWVSLLGHMTTRGDADYPGKAWFFRQLFQIPVNVTLGLAGFLTLATIFANVALGQLVGIWALVLRDVVIPSLYWLVFSSAALLCVSIVMGIYKLGGVYKLPRKIQIWVANLYSIFSGTDYREVLGVIGVVVLTVPVQAFAFALLFNVFDQQLPLVYLVFIAIFANLSRTFSLLPANLGVRELIILLMLAHLDISLVAVVSILLVDRILHLLVLLALSLPAYYKLKQGNAALQTSV